MSNSFTYNGSTMSSYGLYVDRIEGALGLPMPRVDVEQIAGGDGYITQGESFEGRRITAMVHVEASSCGWAGLKSRLASIAGVLADGQAGEKALVFDAISDRTYRARCVSGFTPQYSVGGASGSIEFICPNPWTEGSSSTGSGSITG